MPLNNATIFWIKELYMVLTGNYDGEVESIECMGIGQDVVSTDKQGKLVETRAAHALTINDKDRILPTAPDNCPLLKDPSTRELIDYAACGMCGLAVTVTDGAVEI
ncbi:MAG: hypothetical protein ACYCPS_01335 [Candidatus Saccharimonadales bacterium]